MTLCLLATGYPSASAQQLDEYEVKAAFLYNFTKFVEWPAQSNSPFAICIYGDDPFGPTIDQLVRGKSVGGRFIIIRRLKEPIEARQCQIAFVTRSEEAKAQKLVEAVQGTPVLTVGERSKFGKLGGMIFLVMQDNHVSVGVNVPAAEKAGLKLSAKLMSVAKQFKEEG